MRTGYYVGTGASRSITGLGFQPDLVIINPSTTAGVAVFKTSAMAAANTAYFSATADDTASNLSLDTDGFSVGALANVNSANVLYRWTAFSGSDCSATGYFCVGSYTGTGTTSRTITTGFQPDMVTVKRSTAVASHFRTTSMATNRTEFFTSTAANTAGAYIASASSTGFTVGTTDNTNAATFYYFAFRDSTGSFAEGTYSGNGTDGRSVTGVGFQPDEVVIKNSTSTTTNNRRSVISGDEHYGDLSSYLSDSVADATNMIQGMEADGFQVGSGNNVNQSGVTLYWFAFGGAAAQPAGSGSFSMAQGSYTGSGAARSITGVGFAPDLVLIKDNAANYAVFRISQMAGDITAYMSNATTDFAGGITSLDSNGFGLGTSTIVNTSGNTYQWQAFGNAYQSDTGSGAADFATGVYYGNGIDSRAIGDLPFQPDLVTLKRNAGSAAAFRTSAEPGDLTSFFGTTAESADVVQSLTSSGFQIGTNASVNTSGSLYRWFAFKSGSNFAVGSYTGNGTTGLQVTAPFWSDLIWIKRTTNITGAQRPSTLAGTAGQYFANTANATTLVTGINASGFTVGNSTSTNTSGATYRYAVWRVPPTGTLGVDIVDGSGNSVSSPSSSFTSLATTFSCTESTASLGVAAQKIRISNLSGNSNWTLSFAATDGPTALWRTSGDTAQFDFNDVAGSPNGCQDGADADGVSGKLRVVTSGATLAAQTSCTTTNLSLGTDQDFNEGVVNAVTLLTAASGSNTECYWDLTGIGLRQTVPPEQANGTYSINFTLTATSY